MATGTYPPQVAAAAKHAHRELAGRVDGQLALLALSGSFAYGTDHAGSDVDLRGVYVAPTRTVLGLRNPQEQYELSEPDTVVFELGKFCYLAAAGNPNVLEVLFSPEVFHASAAGELLVANREVFLSRKVVATYGGYAMSQRKRVLAQEPTGEFKRRRGKHLLHCFRLLEAGTALLTDATLTVRVDDPARLRAMAELDDASAAREFDERLAAFDAAAETSTLPDVPDLDRLDALVVEARELDG